MLDRAWLSPVRDWAWRACWEQRPRARPASARGRGAGPRRWLCRPRRAPKGAGSAQNAAMTTEHYRETARASARLEERGRSQAALPRRAAGPRDGGVPAPRPPRRGGPRGRERDHAALRRRAAGPRVGSEPAPRPPSRSGPRATPTTRLSSGWTTAARIPPQIARPRTRSRTACWDATASSRSAASPCPGGVGTSDGSQSLGNPTRRSRNGARTPR